MNAVTAKHKLALSSLWVKLRWKWGPLLQHFQTSKKKQSQNLGLSSLGFSNALKTINNTTVWCVSLLQHIQMKRWSTMATAPNKHQDFVHRFVGLEYYMVVLKNVCIKRVTFRSLLPDLKYFYAACCWLVGRSLFSHSSFINIWVDVYSPRPSREDQRRGRRLWPR